MEKTSQHGKRQEPLRLGEGSHTACLCVMSCAPRLVAGARREAGCESSLETGLWLSLPPWTGPKAKPSGSSEHSHCPVEHDPLAPTLQVKHRAGSSRCGLQGGELGSPQCLLVAVGDGAEVSVYAWASSRLGNFPECGMASGTSSAAIEGPAQDLGIMVWMGRSPQGVCTQQRAGGIGTC